MSEFLQPIFLVAIAHLRHGHDGPGQSQDQQQQHEHEILNINIWNDPIYPLELTVPSMQRLSLYAPQHPKKVTRMEPMAAMRRRAAVVL